ncbi:MAG: galactokinase [Bacteroidales bacterium]|nr:galactokinase [Bacteroidales bacterium]
MDTTELKNKFTEIYGESKEQIHAFFAPGRVNLIGEHTDYNGGYVLPCALDYGTYLLVRKCDKKHISLTTTEFEYAPTIPLDLIHEKHGQEWVNYPLGIIDQFRKLNSQLQTGAELLFSGTIPHGAGLSSSASIEMVTAVALNDIFSFGHSLVELIQLSQRAENDFVGMNCGIMDQFAVGMGRENHAVFLDTDTLDYELVPVKLKDHKLIISNTNKQRKLTDSKYNERRTECEQALEHLNKEGQAFKNLGKIEYTQFQKVQERIPDPVLQKRARHVITEDKRVIAATQALNSGDLETFGRLMNESHDSLRDDYEVTGKELDTLVDEARKLEGVLGSRMTGAGFGGCTVSLVRAEATEAFISQVGKNYEAKTGLKPEFYTTLIRDGAKKINI